ncbi:thioredoxin family protein [Spongiivirga sp. MCCC 1A20706]|uniref:thioredoxin family protein n=1 Tax=Spongiivirga sp. MCCC 1A20706 TaxID=3160963 RepID=UPI0039772E02
MKTLFLVLTICVFSFTQAQETTLKWHTDFEKAKKVAKTEDKPILMYFTGSDWCGPCKMLKRDFFNSDKFAEKAEKLVLVVVDIPRRRDMLTPEQRQKNMKLMGEYNKRGLFPTVLQLDAKGKVKNSINSYSGSPELYFDFVDKML